MAASSRWNAAASSALLTVGLAAVGAPFVGLGAFVVGTGSWFGDDGVAGVARTRAEDCPASALSTLTRLAQHAQARTPVRRVPLMRLVP
ncbi:MAG: hypothetical protein FJ270_05915 [Planctomycetes bacterium]|nr:hypothetical protein [Planctomycetota bacterium]